MDRRIGILLLFLSYAVSARARVASIEATIPVDEVRPGMHGYGLSVFSGTEPQRFEVETLGVLRNLRPGTSFLLVRLTGRDLEKTGIVAGMSGSPIYLDGRLAGAVAFGWPFEREAIAGVTPIAEMRAGSTGGTFGLPSPPATRPGISAVLSEIASGRPSVGRLEDALAALAAPSGSPEGRAGVLWSASGFGEPTLARLRSALPALAPAGGGSATAPGSASGRTSERGPDAASLVPGGSVAALLVDGDLHLAGTGTVTEREGDRLLAFGHPLFGMGDVSIPLAPAEVVSVLASSQSSFKLANSGDAVGAFTRDYATGLEGRIGAVARTIPVAISVGGAAPRRFSVRIADVPALLPVLAAISVGGALDFASPSGGIRSLDLELRLAIDGGRTMALRQSFDGDAAAGAAAAYLYIASAFLESNDLGRARIRQIDVAFTPAGERRQETLVSVAADRVELAPGDPVDLRLGFRSLSGDLRESTIRVVVPREVPEGTYSIWIGDGGAIDTLRLASTVAPPATLAQALDFFASLHSSRELVVVGVLPIRGLAVAGDALAQLPGSIAALWSGAGVRNAQPLRAALIQELVFPQRDPIAGMVRVDLRVRRDASGRESGARP